MSKWDKRFIELAQLVASWSKDPSTKCGAVIIRPDKTLASVGFNGFPKGCDDSEEIYNNRELKYGRMVHAEVNAILHAQEDLTGYTIYTAQDPPIGASCDRCTTNVIQAGIKEIKYLAPKVLEERWRESLDRGLAMYKEAGVSVIPLEICTT